MATASTLDDTIDVRVTPFGRTIHTHPGGAVPDTVGRFRVLGELARGGMGVVLRAYDETLDREVAVKLSAPAAGPRAAHEPLILGRLHHPNIIAVHEAGTLPDGRAYFAMPFVEGRTLSAGLAGRATPGGGLRRWVRVFHQVCRAVAHAHRRGVVHRDLKPSNVMVCGAGRAHVLDWGIAREAGAADAGGDWVCGTPAYMAPEQYTGTTADPRSDVFGLGAILCVILTGDAPYMGLVPAAVTTRAVEGDQAEMRARLARCGAPPALVTLAEDCLSPAVEDRPVDAGTVARRVAEYLTAAEGLPARPRGRRADGLASAGRA